MDQLTLKHFETLAQRAEIDWQIIKGHITETIEKARDIWPSFLKNLPMADNQKKKLKKHWQNLTPDFKIF